MDLSKYVPLLIEAFDEIKQLKAAIQENTFELKKLNESNEIYQEDEEKKNALQDRIVNLLDKVGIDVENVETMSENDIIEQMQKKMTGNNKN